MKKRPVKRGEWVLLLGPLLGLAAIGLASRNSTLRAWWESLDVGNAPNWSVVAWTPDSKFIVIGGGIARYPKPLQGTPISSKPVYIRGDVDLFDTTAHPVRSFVGHGEPVYDTSVSPDGKRLLSRSNDNIRLWNLATGALLHSYVMRSAACRWSSDGGSLQCHGLMWARRPGRARLVSTGAKIDMVSGTLTQSPTMALSPRWTTWKDCTNGIYSARRRHLRSVLKNGAMPGSPQEEWSGGEIDIFNKVGQIVRTLPRHKSEAIALDVMGWRGTREFLQLFPIEKDSMTVGLLFTIVNVTTGAKKSKLLAPPPIDTTPTPRKPPTPEFARVSSRYSGPLTGCFSPNGKYMAVCSANTFWLMTTASPTPIAAWPVKNYKMPMSHVRFSPNSRSLAFLLDNKLHVIECASGDPARP